LLGEFAAERYPASNRKRAKIVVLPKRAKGELVESSPEQIAESLAKWSHVIQRGLLVLGPKSVLVAPKGGSSAFADELLARLNSMRRAKVGFGTFGALRGRNDLVEYDAVYLLNPHRYSPEAYFGLAMLTANKAPVKETFQSFNTVQSSIAELGIEDRAIATEMIQDVMRIALRSDESMRQLGGFAHVFLPVEGKAGIVVRVAAALAGCTVVANGKEFVVPPTLHEEGRGL
jgi:hypothetical protein